MVMTSWTVITAPLKVTFVAAMRMKYGDCAEERNGCPLTYTYATGRTTTVDRNLVSAMWW
jgi:hypothetical protein